MTALIGDELDRTWHGITSHLPHHQPRYHQHQDQTPEGPPAMDLATLEQDIRTDVQAFKDSAEADYNRAKAFIDLRLPAVSDLVAKAAANPLVDAALSAVHLSPDMLTALAGVIAKADSDIAALTPVPAEPATPAGEPADPQPAQISGIAQ